MHDSLFPRTLAMEWRIPFLAGRPRRKTAIDMDDVFNLRIALGLHHDVLELSSDPHLFANVSGDPLSVDDSSVLIR